MSRPAELPLAHHKLNTPAADVTRTQNALDEWCQKNKVDAVLVTAQDAFLSEYTPLSANHRYALSGFSGSTGDGIFLTQTLSQQVGSQGRFQLFVDGRYHLQADQETRSSEVHVHKFALSAGLDESMSTWMRQSLPAGTRLAIDLSRISWNRLRSLQALAQEKSMQLLPLKNGGLAPLLPGTTGWTTQRPIESVSESVTGRSPAKNLADLRAAIRTRLGHDEYIYMTCMSDDAAWLLNARGYHLPQLSSLLAYIFITPHTCLVHLPVESEQCAAHLDTLNGHIQITRGALETVITHLNAETKNHSHPRSVCFSGRAMNAALPLLLRDCYPQADLIDDLHALEGIRAQKTPQELTAIRTSFLRSSRAIARTLRHAKQCAAQKIALSEQDLADTIKSEYAGEGALELSFKTISGFAENGAVIHYSTPNSNKLAQAGDLLLLDSGAYYQEGFATDCTRVVLFGNSSAAAAAWQKEIYTLTLKSCLAGLRSTFNLETPCQSVDALTRDVVKSKGYDYAHGTGHGIGIHVHESGIRLSPASQYAFTEGAVVSVEPGIYLAGKGGVRIENVAVVVANPDTAADHSHAFENIVFVGYDWDLIDLTLLSSDDKNDLAAYERKCQSLGTHVTACPLL